MFNLLLLCASVLLAACAGSSSQPASSPPPAAAPGAEPQPATSDEPEGGTTERDDLKGELAGVDGALMDLNKRLETARDSVKAELRQQVAALQKRDDELKAKLKTTGSRVGAEAEKVRHEIHGAIMDLKGDMQRLTDRVQR